MLNYGAEIMVDRRPLNLMEIPQSQVLFLLVDSTLPDVKGIARKSAIKNAQPGSYLAVVQPVGQNDLPRMFGEARYIAKSLLFGSGDDTSRYSPFNIFYLHK